MSEEELTRFENYDIENGFEVRAGEARQYLVWCKDECIRQYVNHVIDKEYAESAIDDITAMIKQVEEMKVKDWVKIFEHPMSPSNIAIKKREE